MNVVLDCVGKGLAEKLARFVYNGDRLVTCGAAAGGQPNDDTTAIVSTKHFKNLRLDSGRPEIAQLVSFKPIVDSVVPLRGGGCRSAASRRGRQFAKSSCRFQPDSTHPSLVAKYSVAFPLNIPLLALDFLLTKRVMVARAVEVNDVLLTRILKYRSI